MPHMARAAGKTAEITKNPNWDHVYLWSTRHLAVQYSASSNTGDISGTYDKLTFQNTADASFAKILDRRSGEGYILKLFGSLLDWSLRKQATVSPSTTEAELLSNVVAKCQQASFVVEQFLYSVRDLLWIQGMAQ